jgi:DNA-binding NarL/FixJ family response regulator
MGDNEPFAELAENVSALRRSTHELQLRRDALRTTRATMRDSVQTLLALARSRALPFSTNGASPVEGAGTTYGLTEREIEILRLVAAGKSDKEVAGELSISSLTVHSHVRRILEKMDSASRTEACVRALRAGLIA